MNVELVKMFRFEAAHCLPRAPEGHRCRQLHGHAYRIELHVVGEVDPGSGWLIDFAVMEKAFEPARRELDHHCLNEVSGLENPTAENIARWIWDRVSPLLPGLSMVTVHETESSRCHYRGEG